MEPSLEQTEVQAMRAKITGASITRVSHGIVNSYLVADSTTGNWMLVDAGLSTSARKIIRAAEQRFGQRSPACIVLTHGHFDHVGALRELVAYWNVPVYVHPLERPYVTGMASYPPADPTVGGGMMAAVMSRFFPRGPIDLGEHIELLPEDRTIPGIGDWRWVHTPGHSPGHVSLFRERDSVLIVGDAFVTTRQESAFCVMSQRQEVFRPPAYFTPDWKAARHSIEVLASLEPSVAATGHGIPMAGAELREGLDRLLEDFELIMPHHGRYVTWSAEFDEHGVRSIPPAVSDPLPKVAMIAGLVAVAGLVFMRRRA